MVGSYDSQPCRNNVLKCDVVAYMIARGPRMETTMKTRRILTLMTIVSLIFVAGCSDDDSNSTVLQNGSDARSSQDGGGDDFGGSDMVTIDAANPQDMSSSTDTGAADMTTNDMAAQDMASTDVGSDASAADMQVADMSGAGDMAAGTDMRVPFVCPRPRPPEEICIQVIAWAKDPETGNCCQYPTPCQAPEGWQTFNTQGECQTM